MKQDVFSIVEQKYDRIRSIAKQLHDNPEISMQEKFAAKMLTENFAEEGFTIKAVEGLPTAFVAEYGSGKPIIGLLGEYDALPDLSQKVKPTHDPAVKGGPGHGCGHNLVAAGNAGAVFAIKELIAKGELKGTIRYYGTPAEEQIIGKIFMAQKGYFDDLDASMQYHPYGFPAVVGMNINSVVSVKFKFHGVSSHAAVDPENGRSALDAVELMNVGSNYLREHIIDAARVHYCLTDGPSAPNIVPDYASSWYLIRAPKKNLVYEIFDRVVDIAKGAALMTGTTMEYEILSDAYDILNNVTLEDLAAKNMEDLGPIPFSADEKKFAKELLKTIPDEIQQGMRKQFGVAEGTFLADKSIGVFGRGGTLAGSSDLGDISYKAPTVMVAVSAWPLGVSPHSWQATASAGSEIGMKSAIYAAKMLAGTIYDLMSESGAEILAAAQAEFNEKRVPYVTKFPEDYTAPEIVND